MENITGSTGARECKSGAGEAGCVSLLGLLGQRATGWVASNNRNALSQFWRLGTTAGLVSSRTLRGSRLPACAPAPRFAGCPRHGLHTAFSLSVCLCGQISFYKNISHVQLGPILVTASYWVTSVKTGFPEVMVRDAEG